MTQARALPRDAPTAAPNAPVRPAIAVDPNACAEAILARVGRRIVLALPLGLGKATSIANALYARAARDPAIELEILTALSLEKPRDGAYVAQRFFDPIVARLFGDYPELAYVSALRNGTLPPNIRVTEFYLRQGAWLEVPQMQQAYASLNFTDIGREIMRRGVNVLAQLVAKRATPDGVRYSFSCNPDVSAELVPQLAAQRERGRPIVIVGQVNDELPFMTGDAEAAPEHFDWVLDADALAFRLFAPPRRAVSLIDYAMGLHVARLVQDGGTLQIGIGSIGDAVAYALILRHQQPEAFRAALAALDPTATTLTSECEPFAEGLYGLSEMLVDAFVDLYRAGILKRRVPLGRDRGGPGPVAHAAFFLGSRAMYQALRELSETAVHDIAMTGVSFTNSLWGDEPLKRAQRRHARFVNAAMMATLFGEAVSDTLDDGRVVSGVGGQHDFVAQAHALDDARSIIVMHSTRELGGATSSNIRWTCAHATIPRHLRDIIVTEYGIADLRGRSDRDCIAAMLAVSDARFQAPLVRAAKRAHKLEAGYRLSERAQQNRPARIAHALAPFKVQGLFPEYPFGTDFTRTEQRLARALERLKHWSHSKTLLARRAVQGLIAADAGSHYEALARLGLAHPQDLREHLYRALVIAALRETDDILS